MTESKQRNCLILTQRRGVSDYNDFVGKFYHFPATKNKNYLKQFENLPIEFVYFEPQNEGDGKFFGYGRIEKAPFLDNREADHYFVEISDYKPFSKPVHFKNEDGIVLESIHNPEHYNYQNSVRKVNPSFLDELCLDGAIELNFRADAHLIKVLGEQLIGSEKVGILELVKNSIDASASFCRIRMEKIQGLDPIDESEFEFSEFDGPVIVIEDDGVGMDRSIIENGWLRPASTFKTSVKERLRIEREKAQESGNLGAYESLIDELKKENDGRIPLGEKGVGRFATHRLGRNLEIRTKTKGSAFENVLVIDWDLFDNVSGANTNLDAIAVRLFRQAPSRDYGLRDCGTQIIISGGRNGFSWSKEKIDDINESILRLNSPRPHPEVVSNSFRVFLECPQYTELLQERIIDRYRPNFSLHALVNADGVVDEYKLSFVPPSTLNAPLAKEVWQDKNYDLRVASGSKRWRNPDGTMRMPKCGAFFISIDSWYRKREWIEGPDFRELLDYLTRYGGLSIYRDNILISSAEDGTRNDWLDLSVRHIKQGFRISYYNLVGNIEIEQTENLDLIDKTNREGMVENEAYLDLAELVKTIIQNILEVRYIAKRDEVTNLTKGLIRDPEKLGTITKQNSRILEGIIENYALDEDPWHMLHQLGESVEDRKSGLINLNSSIKNLKKSIGLIEEVQERLTEHAGFGIAAAVSIHEIAKITSNFYNGVTHLLNSKSHDPLKLDDLKTASLSLKSELKRLSPLRAVRNEKRREFNVSQSLKYSFEIFKLKLQKEKIEFEFNQEHDFTVFGRYATLNQILGNLFDNSIYWLMTSSKPRRIKVVLNNFHRTLIFTDSGPGIDPNIQPYLFEPGYSMKIPPSGLGLYICKSFMHSMDGDIHETSTRERVQEIEGAQFTLEFESVPDQKEHAK